MIGCSVDLSGQDLAPNLELVGEDGNKQLN
jgi:hypothetical protein